MKENKKNLTGLDLLRSPFAEHQISKLPKPTKQQTDEVKSDFKKGVRCEVCGGWHHPKVVHLDYVGHAALTDRLLDCDLNWNWEPTVINQDGSPKVDSNGGLWIKLTVCGVTRLGYGHPDGKSGGDSIKETIGDALRNAAMRFGAALDLWHKGDLHDSKNEDKAEPSQAEKNVSDLKEVMKDAQWERVEDKPKNPIFEKKTPDIMNAPELGDYVINFGKSKDKKLSDFKPLDLSEYLNNIEKCINEGINGKPVGGKLKENMKELLDVGGKYLTEIYSKQDPPKIEDDEMKF